MIITVLVPTTVAYYPTVFFIFPPFTVFFFRTVILALKRNIVKQIEYTVFSLYWHITINNRSNVAICVSHNVQYQVLGNQLVKYRQEGQSHFLFRLCDSSPPLRTKCPNISLTLHTRLVMTHTINK